jgi:hypothetical protein
MPQFTVLNLNSKNGGMNYSYLNSEILLLFIPLALRLRVQFVLFLY